MSPKPADFTKELTAVQTCQKCSASLKRGLAARKQPVQESRQSLQEALLAQLCLFKCLSCKSSICIACGDGFDTNEESDGMEEDLDSDFGDVDEDSEDFLDHAFEEQATGWTERLFHCQNSTLFVIYEILIQVELVLVADADLQKDRMSSGVKRLKKSGSKSSQGRNGIGYDSSISNLMKDVDGWDVENAKNDARLHNTWDQVESFLDMLIPYLPNPNKENPTTADLLPHSSLLSLLSNSCLGPLFKRLFKNASIEDLFEFKILFKKLVEVLQILASNEITKPWLFQPLLLKSQLLDPQVTLETGSDSIYSLWAVIGKQAEVYRKIHNSAAEKSHDTPQENNEENDLEMIRMCQEIEELFQVFAADAPTYPPSITTASLPVAPSSSSISVKRHGWDLEIPEPPAAEVKSYEEAIKAISFEEVDMHIPDSEQYAHHYSHSLLASNMQVSQSRLKAIAKEISVLSTSAPVSFATSACVRVADDKFDSVQLLLTGPEGTPYANGLFLFDILFPTNYPQEPPQFNYRTNGNGAWRANPNLYNVCIC